MIPEFDLEGGIVVAGDKDVGRPDVAVGHPALLQVPHGLGQRRARLDQVHVAEGLVVVLRKGKLFSRVNQ